MLVRGELHTGVAATAAAAAAAAAAQPGLRGAVEERQQGEHASWDVGRQLAI